MKKSNLYLSIFSALIISACGSSSSNDNQSVDPTPTPTPTHTQNTNTNPKPTKPQSPAANPTPEANQQAQAQSNQTQNNQPINSKKAPAIKSKPNTHKHNGQGGNGQGNTPNAGNGPIKAADLTGLAAKPEADLQNLLNAAAAAAGNAKAKKEAAQKLTDPNAMTGLPKQIEAVKMSLAGKAAAVTSAATDLKATPNDPAKKTALAEAVAKFEDSKKELQKLTNELEQARKDEAEQAALQKVAEAEQAAYQNALDTQKADKEDPEAVVEAKKVKEEELKLKAEKDAAEGNKAALEAEVAAIDDQVATLKKQNEENKKVTNNANTPADVKEKLEAETKANDEKIAQLEKDKKEKEEAVLAADKKVQVIGIDVTAAEKVTQKAEEAAEYRGVYGDGKYESTSFQNVKKVTPTFKNSSPSWFADGWELSLKDGDKDVTIKISDLPKELKSGFDIYAKFDREKKILAAVNGTHSIYGYVDSDFFAAGAVTKKDKIPNGLVEYKNMHNGSRKEANKAFLKTKTGNVDLVADVVGAKANFGTKEFEGEFNNFREYVFTTSQGNIVGAYNAITAPVKFKADIKGSKFVPKDGQPSDYAKVYGYFYKDNAEEAAGLVDHKDFHGAFGIRQ